ncbi:hypothetical protein C4565_09720 [Candidatus Parcubacteria bacterium]|jgi:hypothetical protein|nr:MAG: hypothetical protein C4565_09720 [Candidatus Parcubacteria bacterium]
MARKRELSSEANKCGRYLMKKGRVRFYRGVHCLMRPSNQVVGYVVSDSIATSNILKNQTSLWLIDLLFIRSQNFSGTPPNLKQNSGLQKRKCNPRPGELVPDLTGAALDAG